MGVFLNNVGGNYFRLMGTRVVAGRSIDSRDGAGAPLAVVVSQTFARTVFGNRDALGNWLRIDGQLRQVVGIAEDGLRLTCTSSRSRSSFSHTPRRYRTTSLCWWKPRATRPRSTALPAPQSMVSTPGARLRIDHFAEDPGRRPLDGPFCRHRHQCAGRQRGPAHRGGLFGVLLYAVNRRTREFGLRVALGARPRQIERLVMGESLRMAAIGVPIGLAALAAAASSRARCCSA